MFYCWRKISVVTVSSPSGDMFDYQHQRFHRDTDVPGSAQHTAQIWLLSAR